MTLTRQPHIKIYQDFPEAQYLQQPMAPQPRPRPQLAPSAMPLQPTNHVQQYRQPTHMMHPSLTASQQISPLKSQHFTPPQLHNTLDFIPDLGYRESPSIFNGSPVKTMTLPSSQPMPLTSHIPMQPMYATFDNTFNQENYIPSMPMVNHDSYVDFPDPASIRKQSLKRSYSDVTGTQAGLMKRLKTDDVETTDITDTNEMPLIEDDGRKPPYSYAQMIGMAIMRAPGRRLTLANIYEWISSTFRFYREDPKTGWHNSIRHNLSLNKAFKKVDRPKGDAGKGSYWIVVPGQEAQFFKEKTKRAHTNGISIQQYGQQPTMHVHPAPVSQSLAPNPWPVQPTFEPPPHLLPPRPQTASALPELSSDATVPASDPALAEEADADVFTSRPIPELAAPIVLHPPSSPPVLNSSPPIMRNLQDIKRPSSPAPAADQLYRKHKRNLTGTMDDSGYFSSLDSSIRRPKIASMPQSDVDVEKPHMKLGRAEEELVRLRSSSHDLTPSHNRHKNALLEVPEPASPTHSPDLFKTNPMTPAVVFKKPLLPPQSVSPNTQLRKHREAMAAIIGSPAKTDDVFGLSTESPAHRASHSFDDSFLYMFEAGRENIFSSPLKAPASIKKSLPPPKGNVLGDVTNKVGNSMLSSKTPSRIPGNFTFKAPISTSFAGSPLKRSTTTSINDLTIPKEHNELDDMLNDENADHLFDFGSFPEDDSGEELDISQGFGKIGATSNISAPGLQRPALSRHHTTRF